MDPLGGFYQREMRTPRLGERRRYSNLSELRVLCFKSFPLAFNPVSQIYSKASVILILDFPSTMRDMIAK